MALLYNLARMTTATTGTGTITLGSAVSGYLTFALAGVANGDVVSYGIKDGANSEVGTGTYTTAGTTLTRTVTKSTNSNAAISLSGAAEIFITPRAEDLTVTVAAVQSDQETGTSNTVAVTPGTQKFHPSAAKAWVYFDGKTGGVATIKSSFGVTSAVRNSAGNYTVNWSTAFSSATAYSIQITASDPSVTIGLPFLTGTPIVAGSVTFQTRDALAPANPADMAVVMVVAHGDQ